MAPETDAVLREIGARIGTVPDLEQAGDTYRIGFTPSHLVYVAADPDGRRHVHREGLRLRWAASAGIPVPEVVDLDEDGRWLITERVRRDPPRGRAFVRAAVDGAGTIARADPPPPRLLEGSETRRAPGKGRVLRALRLALGGVRIREFVRVRAAALALEADTLAHGDYQANNVLYDAEAGAVRLTDFEYLGFAPAGTDLLHLWCTLEEGGDRDAVLEAVLAGSGPEERERLGILHLWIALRTLAEHLTGPDLGTDRLDLARRRVVEARTNAEAWGGR